MLLAEAVACCCMHRLHYRVQAAAVFSGLLLLHAILMPLQLLLLLLSLALLLNPVTAQS
jgi:hypothetical protein